MMRTENLEMGSGDSYMNMYEKISDLYVQRMRSSLRDRAAKNTRYWVILILGVLLIILVSLVSLLFVYYKGVREETSLLKNNDSADPKCSVGWTKYGLSCYYLSLESKPWIDASKDCEDNKAHLVVINGEGEKDFLSEFSRVKHVWIGLSDEDGAWKWVDGTSYINTPTFWDVNQPDNWKGHDRGGGEDCVQIRDRDKWNDAPCSLSFQYICEKEIF